MDMNSGLAVELCEQSGNSPISGSSTEIQGRLLQAADPASGASDSYGFKPLQELVCRCGGNERRSKIRDFPNGFGR